jgi:hypothetical protein
MPDFYFILFLMRLDADEKLQYFQPYIPCLMVSGNEIKLCLKYFCLPIYFVHFEIRVLTIYLIFYAVTLCFIMFICPFVGPLIWINKILYLV